jgi:hypothetical protein
MILNRAMPWYRDEFLRRELRDGLS